LQRWQVQADRGERFDEELPIVDGRAEHRWLRFVAEPSRTVDNEYRGLILDITAAKLAQSRRAWDEQLLELALVNGKLALVDWDIESGRLAPNPQLAKLVELEDGEVVATAQRLAEYEFPKDKPRVHAELEQHLYGGREEFQCEYRVRTERGRTRWVRASGRVISRSETGRPMRYVGTLEDITAPLLAEQELEKEIARSQAVTRISTELAREVRQLEGEIRQISHREQERIGHDLHDGLGQELTGVSLMLKTLEHTIVSEAPQLSARVRAVRDMVEQCIATTRALAQGLSPVHLDRDGFAGALEQLAATSEAFYGIPVKFSCQRSGISPEHGAATDLYRIAQEAISNAAKHAGAREIRLRLIADPDRLVVTVEDDGRGIPPGGEHKGGMGLKIMRYRATIIGATLDIVSREGGGTTVRCTLRHPMGGVAPGERND
jgi:PAS domain S-box-containing protein